MAGIASATECKCCLEHLGVRDDNLLVRRRGRWNREKENKRKRGRERGTQSEREGD